MDLSHPGFHSDPSDIDFKTNKSIVINNLAIAERSVDARFQHSSHLNCYLINTSPYSISHK